MLNIQPQFIKQIAPTLSLQQYNEIPMIVLDHPVGQAIISLQGAHLLSWQPKHTAQNVLWLSEVEPFKLGTAIRGGVPVCYPWFGGKSSPSHGYARISMWQLSDYQITEDNATLAFSLFSDDDLIEAKITMTFSDSCELNFKHYGVENAEVALHSYFNIADINPISVEGLPTSCFNSLTQQPEQVPSPRQVAENIDCIYAISNNATHHIVDPIYQRNIEISHKNASNTVFWNPWHKATSGMSEEGYKTMVCVETARIDKPLSQSDQVSVIIKVA
ncbi:Putative glucose-6-phosphate 1-epimerase [Phocoenobacter uteri]|uniref:Putative glucose-6-phosphate 1-epimerase n=1 Tax=Phocoenobacter uteri TaxID=146806 RepID=A0A379C9W9_9PAST|nr:D-hexose-6-phosphate mutarotase [Phocoenobacter uteri]MDG6881160.1 D-hexose-6-phosphate mutarotase [Phocoenobacter uteri]SUB59182.1 Putative glucose-6-phosphate 1-epimerase [Phocoenobacter uteri]